MVFYFGHALSRQHPTGVEHAAYLLGGLHIAAILPAYFKQRMGNLPQGANLDGFH